MLCSGYEFNSSFSLACWSITASYEDNASSARVTFSFNLRHKFDLVLILFLRDIILLRVRSSWSVTVMEDNVLLNLWISFGSSFFLFRLLFASFSLASKYGRDLAGSQSIYKVLLHTVKCHVVVAFLFCQKT